MSIMGMKTNQPRVGPGQFQWSPHGWFGAQLGATVWMLIAAVVLLPRGTEVTGIAFLCFGVPNLVGFLLYRRRQRIAPYPALQVLILVIGIATTLFVVYLNQAGLVQELDPRLGYGRWGFFLLPLLFGGLMVLFHWMERSAVRKRRGGQGA